MTERELVLSGFQPRGDGTLHSPGRINARARRLRLFSHDELPGGDIAMSKKQVSEAKFKSTIDALRQLLTAASDAAHECESGKTEEDRDIDHTHELGWLMKFTADLCSARVRVLTNVAFLLAELQYDDEPGAHPSDTPH